MQSSHAGKQSYKNALSFFSPHSFCLSVHSSVVPRVFIGKSLSLLRVFQRKKNQNHFPPCVWGKQLRSPPVTKYFPSFFPPRTLTPFHDAKSSSNSLHQIFFLIPPPPPLPRFRSGPVLAQESSSQATDSWFVYQNIDLFSLYTCTLALLLVRVFSLFFCFFPPLLPKAPLTGHPYLDIDLPVKPSAAARGTRERWGQYSSGDFLVPNWQCWPLC